MLPLLSHAKMPQAKEFPTLSLSVTATLPVITSGATLLQLMVIFLFVGLA